MIGFHREDGQNVWIAPEHVALIEPVTRNTTRITLAVGESIIVQGTAHDVAVTIAADAVTYPAFSHSSAHPLEME